MQTQTLYRNHTIEPSSSYFGGFDYFPTEEGRQDDYDLVGEDYKYCGNVKHASSLDEAKDGIDEKIMESLPCHLVIVKETHFPFLWIEDAIQFAVRNNGELFPNGDVSAICNA